MIGIPSQRLKELLETLSLSGYISMKVAQEKPVNLFSSADHREIIFIVPHCLENVHEKYLYLFPTPEAILYNDSSLYQSMTKSRPSLVHE